MFSGFKDGLSHIANKKIHEGQVENYNMYVNLECIKFSIIKIFDNKNFINQEIDNKDEKDK